MKLYLSITMIATRDPYDIKQRIPARVWAEMLGLPDPEGNGARRVADALSWLAYQEFVRLSREPGLPPAITLKSPLGDGSAYQRPGRRYITVPLGFWEHQWITHLSGTATAMLIVLLELQGGRDGHQFASAERRTRYGLSVDTWRRGAVELDRANVLNVRSEVVREDFEQRRTRNTYRIDVTAFDCPPLT